MMRKGSPVLRGILLGIYARVVVVLADADVLAGCQRRQGSCGLAGEAGLCACARGPGPH